MFFTRVIWFEVILFLGGLAAIIAYRLLTGGINTRYLLYGTGTIGANGLYSPPAKGTPGSKVTIKAASNEDVGVTDTETSTRFSFFAER